MLDASNTSREIGDRRPEIAVFGIGAIEQHSIHLALGTDWLGVSDITRRVAAELDAFRASMGWNR
jgi:creatinine amidohydrolase/Fe(II)-dependent formamide hydrolase-like protein